MKKLYFIKANGCNMLTSVDKEQKYCKCLTENIYNEFPELSGDEEEQHKIALEFLKSVEDDSSWEDIEYHQIIDDIKKIDNIILAEIEF